MLRAVTTEGYPWNRGKRRRLFEAKGSILQRSWYAFGVPLWPAEAFLFPVVALGKREVLCQKQRTNL